MMREIYNKLKSMVKTGKNISTDDSNPVQTMKASWLGRTSQKVESHVPFGTFGTPLVSSQLILLNKRCNESNVVAIPSDSLNRIKKGTKAGEYGIGNPLTGSNLYFNEAGDCLLVSEGGVVNFNNGSKGVARLDDSTLVNSTTDPTFIAWIAQISAAVNVLAPGAVTPIPTTVTGKISTASSTVKAGD
jgi:phage gp45-like